MVGCILVFLSNLRLVFSSAFCSAFLFGIFVQPFCSADCYACGARA